MKRKLNKQSQLIRIAPALSLALIILALVLVGGVSAGQPEYEPAYINGKTVTINAIEVSQNAPHQAQADLYLVVYPIGWEALGVAPPSEAKSQPQVLPLLLATCSMALPSGLNRITPLLRWPNDLAPSGERGLPSL